jgi:hypothetical protein
MALITLNDLYDKWKKVSDWVTGVDTTSAAAVKLTGSNATDAKAPGNGDVSALQMGFNGSNWDRWRGNTEGTILASAARTATTTSPVQTNHNAKGVMVFLRVSIASGTGGLQLKIQGRDPVTNVGLDLNILPTSITAAGWYIFEIYPGVNGTSTYVTQVTSGILPRSWQVLVTHIDGSSYTYSVGYSLIL